MSSACSSHSSPLEISRCLRTSVNATDYLDRSEARIGCGWAASPHSRLAQEIASRPLKLGLRRLRSRFEPGFEARSRSVPRSRSEELDLSISGPPLIRAREGPAACAAASEPHSIADI